MATIYSLQDRTRELEDMVLKLRCTRIEQGAEIVKLEQRLKALQWTRVDKDHLPKRMIHEVLNKWGFAITVGSDECPNSDLESLQRGDYTHYRALNAPEEDIRG